MKDDVDNMKKRFACLAVASAFLNMPSAFAANEPSKTESVALNAVRKPVTRYEGTLSKKRILMVLSQQGTTVEGAYAYVKQGANEAPRWIDLNGTATATGSVTLVEKFKDKMTGKFDGKIAGNVFSGTWRSPDGKSLARHCGLPVFVVSKVADSAMVTEVETWSVRVSGWNAEIARAVSPLAEIVAVPDTAFDGAALLVSIAGANRLEKIKLALIEAGASVRSTALVGSHATRYTVPPKA